MVADGFVLGLGQLDSSLAAEAVAHGYISSQLWPETLGAFPSQYRKRAVAAVMFDLLPVFRSGCLQAR